MAKQGRPAVGGLGAAISRVASLVAALLNDYRWYTALCLLVLAAETVLGALIIWRVPYTEIDWKAYMQEVEGWAVDGHLDYSQLRGETGPLVYPAGFLYLYRALRAVTGGGHGPAAIRIAQWIFLGVYLVLEALVFSVYGRAKPGPPWMILLLVLSKRVHSLFMLRLFNDCFSTLFAYAGILAATYRQWSFATLLFSLGISVKMNVLLFLPGLLFLFARDGAMGLPGVAWQLLGPLAATQAVLGSPFLLAFPREYLSKAFELGRVFFYQWTVNWKFLPEEVFVSKQVSMLLLAAHLGGLLWFAHFKWAAAEGGVWRMLERHGWLRLLHALPLSASFLPAPTTTPGSRPRRRGGPPSDADTPAYIVAVLLCSNFIGIAFARTLHYQFYVWYFHSLPLLLWCTDLPMALRLAILGGIEYAFNVGDATGAATPVSSAVLQLSHGVLLLGLALGGAKAWGHASAAAGGATVSIQPVPTGGSILTPGAANRPARVISRSRSRRGGSSGPTGASIGRRRRRSSSRSVPSAHI